DCRLVGALRQVAIDAVHADIEPAAEEPLCLALAQVAAADFAKGCLPVEELARHARPEGIRRLHGFAVEGLVAFGIEVGPAFQRVVYGVAGRAVHVYSIQRVKGLLASKGRPARAACKGSADP